MTSKNDLRTCPFCGADDAYIAGIEITTDAGIRDAWQVSCLVCEAMGPLSTSRMDAVELWNLCSDSCVDREALEVAQRKLGLQD